ncbi:MAG: tetratricopeptide repeat protein [Myxococcota bacterium]
MFRPSAPGAGFVLVALSSLAFPAIGATQGLERVSRDVVDIEQRARVLASDPLDRQRLRSPTYVEERLTDGELFFQLQDYGRASIIFTDIVDHHAAHAIYPEAKFLLAESLFMARDYLGARRHYETVLANSDESAFRPYVQNTLGRLIEIAIHTHEFTGVEAYFQRLNRLPPAEVGASTAYFRAKYLYNRAVPSEAVGSEADLSELRVDLPAIESAKRAFEVVAAGSSYYPQAVYFIGVIHALRAEFPQAIEAFRRVLRAPTTEAGHPQVAELAQLALGRLYYETNQLLQAIEAYQSVSRSSPRFDTALYEIAWAFIRLGDSIRAERALEVLQVAAPESRYIPDGQLLRGNLLLRNGRFDDADEVFDDVQAQFEPVGEELDDVLHSHADLPLYFRDLVRTNLEAFDAASVLPPLAQRWSKSEGEVGRALQVIDDLSQARRLVHETAGLVTRLDAAVNSTNAVNVFANLRRHREGTIALRNRLIRARRALMGAEFGPVSSRAIQGLEALREERAQLEQSLDRMPMSDEDFSARDDQALERYRDLQRALRELEVELLGMEARITATDHFLSNPVSQQNSDTSAVASELAAHLEAIERYQKAIDELAGSVEVARMQVGVGDSRYIRDRRLRSDYNNLVDKERQLLASNGLRSSSEAGRLFGQITRVEALLDSHDDEIDAAVASRVAATQQTLEDERLKLAGYRDLLALLEAETEEVIGALAYDHFLQVRDRFHNLLLRSHVGEIDVSWQRREEHRLRVDSLTRDRQREVQTLDDEFREITDQNENGDEEGSAL